MRLLFLVTLFLPVQHAADWTRFRGPNGNGVAEATRLPSDFGPDKKVVWKVTLPEGHSSPVFAGDRIFLTGAEGGKRADAGREKVVDQGGRLYTLCVDRRTGKELWRREVPRPRLERYQPTNSAASPSPATDGKSVFVFFGDYGVIAYDLNGKERWRYQMGPFNNVNGHGSSPIVFEDAVIMLADQDSNSYLVSLDKATGKVKWKVERPEATRSYTTPAIFQPVKGPAELIVPGAYQVISYDARTGEKLWWVRGMSWQPKSTPLIDGDTIYAHSWEGGGEADAPTETPDFAATLAKFDADHDGKVSEAEVAGDKALARGYYLIDLNGDGAVDEREWEFYRARRAARNALLAIRPAGRRGDLTSSAVVWSMRRFLPNVPSPLLYKGVLYLVKDGGIVSSIDPATGKILKQARLEGALDTYYSSPIGAAGLVYFASQLGKVTVLKAGAEWAQIASIDMEDEIFATPAVVDGRLYLRTRHTLYCFEEK